MALRARHGAALHARSSQQCADHPCTMQHPWPLNSTLRVRRFMKTLQCCMLQMKAATLRARNAACECRMQSGLAEAEKGGWQGSMYGSVLQTRLRGLGSEGRLLGRVQLAHEVVCVSMSLQEACMDLRPARCGTSTWRHAGRVAQARHKDRLGLGRRRAGHVCGSRRNFTAWGKVNIKQAL